MTVEDNRYASALSHLAAELKRLRERSEMTLEDVSHKTHVAISTVSAYETGKRMAPLDFATKADDLYGAGGSLVEDQKLADNLSVLPWFRDRVEVEAKASEIREYESYQIPGLLQTQDYARVIVSAVRPMFTEEAVARAVALRIKRQQILEPDDDAQLGHKKPRLWSIIDESALHRVAGGRDIMQEQYRKLLTMAHRPNITIQIVRNSEGPTCAFGRPFAVITARTSNSSVVYMEDIETARYIRDRDEVSRHTLIFDHLRSCALNDKQSIQLLKGLVQ